MATAPRVSGCAILHEPPIVFLDEPTGGVDPLSRRRFWRLINELARGGTTVLVTTHYLDEAEHCHRIAIIHAGRLAALGTVRRAETGIRWPTDSRGACVESGGSDASSRRNAGSREDEHLRHGGARGPAVARHRAGEIAARLRDAGVDAEITGVDPSLEDVFLDVVERSAA